MATLEDAAEELVVRLKGLDSEIEESQHALEDLRGQVEEISKEVEQEWSHLTEAAESFLERVHAEQEHLASQVQQTLQATAEAHGAVQENGALARSEIAEGQANLEVLSQHATALEPGVESLIAEGGEAPATSLAQRVREVEQELARVLDEARDFLRDEVATALDQLSEDVRERCRALRESIVDKTTSALLETFDEWEGKVDQLEDYVSTQGFLASHSHARTVVDWALEECMTVCEAHVSATNTRVEETSLPLQELSAALRLEADALAGSGSDLVAELVGLGDSAGGAVSALDAVKGLLSSYTFVGA